jgi:hypothetical protein
MDLQFIDRGDEMNALNNILQRYSAPHPKNLPLNPQKRETPILKGIRKNF